MNDDPIPLSAFAQINTQDDIGHNAPTFIGKTVVDYGQATPSPKPKKGGFFGFGKAEAEPEERNSPVGGNVIYRFRSDWEDDKLIPNLEQFLDTPAASEARGIVIGSWHADDPERTAADVIAFLVKSRDRLPNLNAIYLGDITSEENEMSWIKQSDLAPLLQAFPRLQLLRSRGGDGLEISAPAHANLRGLALETGGMDIGVIRSICTSNFPNLEHLELWLGTDEYGANHTVADLQPVLSGRLFPKLKYLGLRNSHLADEIAAVVVNSPVLQQIETLDLSLGVLTDEGAKALLKLPPSPTLKNLDLHYNYIGEDLIAQLNKLPVRVDASKPREMESNDEWRFVAVGE
jgi:hypothetical protein